MTNTLETRRRLRRLIPTAIVVIGLLLITVVMIRQVAAQDAGTLKPPFKLVRTGEIASFESHAPAALPLSAPIIMSQTFNSTYSPTPNLNQLGWHESYIAGASSQVTWKYVGTAPLPNTVWSAGSSLLNPATGRYTNGQQSLLIYGPLNLTDYIHVVLSGTYWLDTASTSFVTSTDYFGVAYSTDGTHWDELYAQGSSDPGLSQSHVFYASLDQVARKPVAWIALTFVSNNDNRVARGAFVKDVVLRGSPAARIYLPVIRYDPTPTPTPKPGRYFYAFTNNSPTNNPDFNRWGGYRSTSCDGCTYTYYQDLVTTFGKNPPAFTLYMQGVNGRGGAGPRQNGVSLSTAINFEYSADFYVYNGQLDASYGLVFAASSSTFPDSGNPPINPAYNYYTLELRVDPSDRTKVTRWQFVRVKNGSRSAATNLANLPSTIGQGQWHNIKVTFQGTTMSFYLNGQFVGSGSTDSDWNTDRRRFGLFLQTRASNGDGGPFEFFTDNIGVSDLP